MEYAEAIASGAAHDRCVPGGQKTLNKLNQIVGSSYKKVDMEYGPTINNQKVSIIEEECIGCKKCISACPVDAIVGGMNMRHSVIDDICTGCELCIEPCPVDCIEIIELSDTEILKPRNDSQHFFDNKEFIRIPSKRTKIKNFSSKNLNISEKINLQLKNRDIDKLKNLKSMQISVIKSDLEKIHKYGNEDIDGFIDKNSD
jgi:Na+-translocating ferredoxin:NAD+ oxidoreductase RNF subunit RnfB